MEHLVFAMLLKHNSIGWMFIPELLLKLQIHKQHFSGEILASRFVHGTSSSCCLCSQLALPVCYFAPSVSRHNKTANETNKFKPANSKPKIKICQLKFSTNQSWQFKTSNLAEKQRILMMTILCKINLYVASILLMTFRTSRYMNAIVCACQA